ncbi:metal ABC transporter permease [Candidatus Similichlamydia epinepheli]|uniref:metal ABC transporter permease n=1 Tax=Candidatus Similichlamydia epinepheli TaxID=1903953 RepID=UPI000D3B04C3|nr:metal ABC transporter permease [Candidatus Similichlamydia epinepheli]
MFSDSSFLLLMLPSLFGSFLMGWICGLVGFLAYFLENCLLAEVLSHAAYPGVLIGLWCVWELYGTIELFSWASIFVLFSLILLVISFFIEGYRFLYRKRVPEDALFCWTLSSAMGFSSILLSLFQKKLFFLLPIAQKFLYGQTIFLEWDALVRLVVVAIFITSTFVALRTPIKFLLFDSDFTLFPYRARIVFFVLMRLMLTLAILVGLQAGGIFVVTSLMVAPALSAMVALSRFSFMALFSAFVGALSSSLGLLLSLWLDLHYGVGLPPGPAIVFTAIGLFVLIEVMAWPNGLLARVRKRRNYKRKCFQEILLKTCVKQECSSFSAYLLAPLVGEHFLRVERGLCDLVQSGFMSACTEKNSYILTEKGKREALRILRLHRLWELYLVEKGGVSPEAVHPYAEEMEHAVDLDSSETLQQLLGGLDIDPHGKSIPPPQ